MESSTTSNVTGKDEDMKQDPTKTKLVEIASQLMWAAMDSSTAPNNTCNEEDTKRDPTKTPPSYTDPKLVELASKLHLKPYVQSLFFDTALLFIRKEYNQTAVMKNSNVQGSSASSNPKLVIGMATSSFLQEMGIHIWPSYVKYRQHLTVVSPYGDKRPPMKERMATTIKYKSERDEWERGLRAQKPVKLVHKKALKGLLYLGKGRLEIEKSMRAYMERMLELGVVDEA